MREKLEELDRLHAAAKLGPMVSVHIISKGYEHCANLCTRLEGHKSDYPVAMMQAEWADVIAATMNAFPLLLERLERAEAERDELQSTITACEKEVSEVYRTITNNKFSKMNTQAVYILDDIEKRGTGGWLSQLISYLLSIRATNTCEWMELLAEHINEIAEHIGDEDRVEFNGDGLTVKKQEAKQLREGK